MRRSRRGAFSVFGPHPFIHISQQTKPVKKHYLRKEFALFFCFAENHYLCKPVKSGNGSQH